MEKIKLRDYTVEKVQVPKDQNDDDLCYLLVKKAGSRLRKALVFSIEEMTQREADLIFATMRFMASVHHPAIPRYFEFFAEPNGNMYAVTGIYRVASVESDIGNFLDLNPNLMQAAISFEEQQIIIAQLCALMRQVHGRGMAFISLSTDDYGLDSHLILRLRTLPGMMPFGTMVDSEANIDPQFCAPEVLQGHPLTAKSDIFSLGVAMYQLATNSLPFDGEDFDEIATNNINGNVLPAELPVPKDMADFIKKTMALDPEKRPTADQLLKLKWIKEALDEIKASEPELDEAEKRPIFLLPAVVYNKAMSMADLDRQLAEMTKARLQKVCGGKLEDLPQNGTRDVRTEDLLETYPNSHLQLSTLSTIQINNSENQDGSIDEEGEEESGEEEDLEEEGYEEEYESVMTLEQGFASNQQQHQSQNKDTKIPKAQGQAIKQTNNSIKKSAEQTPLKNTKKLIVKKSVRKSDARKSRANLKQTKMAAKPPLTVEKPKETAGGLLKSQLTVKSEHGHQLDNSKAEATGRATKAESSFGGIREFAEGRSLQFFSTLGQPIRESQKLERVPLPDLILKKPVLPKRKYIPPPPPDY